METGALIRSVLWNGMLAAIPVMLAYMASSVARGSGSRTARAAAVTALLGVWFVFLPNTCYLVTEWRHFMAYVDGSNLYLRAQQDTTLLVQVCALWLFYFLYSGFGLLAFALAIRPISRLATGSGIGMWPWGLGFFVALSLGVYLGLIHRYNTWDLLTGPGAVWSTVVEVSARPKLSAFVVLFGGFLWLAYEALDVWIDGLVQRWYRARSKATCGTTGQEQRAG